MAESIGALHADLSVSIARFEEGMKKATSIVQRSGGQMQKELASISGSLDLLKKSFIALGGITAVKLFFSTITHAAGEQQKVNQLLGQSLANIGVEYRNVKGDLDKFFTSIQKTTTFSDEEASAAFARLVQLTGNYDKSLKSLTPALDLAAGRGLDLTAATQLIGQALEGNLRRLKLIIPAMSAYTDKEFKALSEGERLNVVLGAIEKSFGGMSEVLGGTFQGRMTQVKNALGEIHEALGNFIINSDVGSNAIARITDKMNDWATKINENKEFQKELDAALQDAIETGERFIQFLKDVKKFGDQAATALNTFKDAVDDAAASATLFGEVVVRSLSTPLAAIVRILQNVKKGQEEVNETTQDTLAQGEALQTALEGHAELEKNKAEAIESSTDKLKTYGAGHKTAKSEVERFNESLEKQLEKLKEEIALFGLSETAIIAWHKAQNLAKGATVALANAIEQAQLKLKKMNDQIKESTGLADQTTRFEDMMTPIAEGATHAQEAFSALDVFVGNVLLSISDGFANLIDNVLRGKFDSLKDFWKGMLSAMLTAFSQFIAAVATQKIALSLGVGTGADQATQGFSFTNLLSGIGGSFKSLGGLFTGAFKGISGFFSTLSKALPAIGLIATGVSLILGLFSGIFKKKPKLNISIGVVDMIKGVKARMATVSDFLLAIEDRTSAIAQDLVEFTKRKSGVDAGEMRQLILEIFVKGAIEPIQAIINSLPADMADAINKIFLKTAVSPEIKALLDFRDTGKSIKENLEKFLKELSSGAILAFKSIFQVILTGAGVGVQAARDFIQKQVDIFKQLDPEARAEFGQEFLLKIQAFVDAFNFISGNFGDTAATSLKLIDQLSNKLGIDTPGSIEETLDALEELIKTGKLTPELAQDFITLRNEIINLRVALNETIGTVATKISELNTKIQGLGGAGIAFPLDALKVAIQDIQNLITSGNLSPDELPAALALMEQLTDQLVDGFGEALRMVEQFEAESKRIGDDLRRLFAGPQSIFNPIERLNFLQGEIVKGQQALSGAETEEARLAAIEKLRELSSELIDLGANAFGTSSPEFQAIFSQTAEHLQALLDATQGEGETFDSLLTEAKQFYEFMQGEYFQLLQQKLGQLGEIAQEGIVGTAILLDEQTDILEGIQTASNQTVNILDKIRQQFGSAPTPLTGLAALAKLIPAQSGFHGIITQPQQLFLAHRNEMVDISPFRGRDPDDGGLGGGALSGEITFKHRIILEGTVTERTVDMFARRVPKAIVDSVRSGELREIIKQIPRK